MGGGQPGGLADGMDLQASSGSESRSAPMAASPQRSSGMMSDVDGNERLEIASLGDELDGVSASDLPADRRSRSKFDDSSSDANKLFEDSVNVNELVGPIKVDLSKSIALHAKVFSDGETSIPAKQQAKRPAGFGSSSIGESRKVGDGEERDEAEEKLAENQPDIPAMPMPINKKDKKKVTKTWKRVKAIPNTTRLMVGDKEELDLTGMQVNAQVDGFRARVLIDYLYYNDRDRQLEGNFKLRLPEDSSLYLSLIHI